MTTDHDGTPPRPATTGPPRFRIRWKETPDHVAEQGVADAPDQPAEGVVEEEHPVAEAAHAGQAGDERPGEGHEPAEEDGRASVALEHAHGPPHGGVPLERASLEQPGPDRFPTSNPTESPTMAHTTTTAIMTSRLTAPSPARTPPMTTAVSPGMKNPTSSAASAKARNPTSA